MMPALALVLAACGGSDAAEDGAAADTAAAAGMNGGMTDTTAMAAPADMAAQAPDAQFLTQMSDHHQGLILMAEGAHQKNDVTVHDEATKLSEKQKQEQQQMLSTLQSDFQQQHTPQVMPQNQAMMDSVQAKSGKEYDRVFREAVIRHHQEGIAMIDQFMPRFTNAQVRQMAEKMKAEQQKDIQELQAKLGS